MVTDTNKQILLNLSSIEDLGSFYVSSSVYRDILNNKVFLQELMKSVTSKNVVYPVYQHPEPVNDFESFKRWYNKTIYIKGKM